MISLVTGGTGYLGGRLVTMLLARGDTVRVLHRPESDVSRLSGEVVLMEGDVTAPDSLRRAAEGCERIFHAAALVKTWVRDSSEFDRINVRGTENVFRIAAEANARLIYTSSFFALGPTGPTPVGEDHVRSTLPYCTDYERTKTEADRIARQFLDEGRDAVVLYPGLVYGPGPMTQGNYVSQLALDLLRGRLPGVPGSGDQVWTFAYIEDVAAAHLTAADLARPGSRYILGGPTATVRETLRILGELLRVRTPRLNIPIPILRMVGLFGEGFAQVTGKAPKLTRGVAEVYRRHWAYDSSRAARDLGYPIRPLVEGLGEVVRYIKGFSHT
ncbi:MAG: NAD-dependent epimerase/dehydratase family protein [Candidatus Omnitrophica bacterium]|nr:Aurachin B dehydrogenase [bacterium]NUN97072.1 NAD-dependent epimerase/dehydratase family protein [Candidatus Omnitrophota bacterium]